MSSLVLIACVAASSYPGYGAGDLDPTFGIAGTVLTDLGPGNGGEAVAVAIQADGKIVAAGNSFNGNNSDFSLVRYETDGRVDPTFGDAGIVITHVGNRDDPPLDVAIQADGKIVAVGGTRRERLEFAVVRYETNGALDETFGEDGVISTAVGSSFSLARGLVIQADGRIVVVGTASSANDDDIALARYNSDGTLDSSFGVEGIVTTRIGDGRDSASSIALQSDGKIVVAGNSENGDVYDAILVRYNADGSRDAAFGEGGIVTTRTDAEYLSPNSIAVQSDGKLVVGVLAADEQEADDELLILRYAPTGELDASFGTDGIVVNDVENTPGGIVAIQPDGKIVATATDRGQFSVARYNEDGSIDAGFGTQGTVNTPAGVSGSGALDLALQADGKIVVAGGAYDGQNGRVAIVRYDQDGRLDTGFADAGISTVLVGRSTDKASDVAIQTDGKIVVAGNADGAIAFARYDSAGSLDSSFGAAGIVIGDMRESVSSLEIQADGKLVATTLDLFDAPTGDFSVLRYDGDGNVDAGFGTDGVARAAVGPENDRAFDVAIQDDGKLIVVGLSRNDVDFDIAIVRYTSAGAVDMGFGDEGIVTTSISPSFDSLYSVALQGDGKIVAAGTVQESDGSYSILVVRYDSEGRLDEEFGISGVVTTAISSEFDVAYDVAIQNDGKILVAGYSKYREVTSIVLVRYNADGGHDPSFGTGGVVTRQLEVAPVDAPLRLSLQTDGKSVVATTLDTGDFTDFGILRYDTMGNRDSTFGEDGVVVTDLGGSDDVASGIAIDETGKIMIAGSYGGPLGADFAIVRYSVATCGDTTGDGRVSATDALFTLDASLGVTTCDLCVCDMDGSADVTATDALIALQSAVGLDVVADCRGC